MNKMRQDAWTKKEDEMLANTIIRHIQTGKTQLVAFQNIAKQLSRTPAACGYRWNATVRKRYLTEINRAKEMRKHYVRTKAIKQESDEDKKVIASAIEMLQKLHENTTQSVQSESIEQAESFTLLKERNSELENKLRRYEQAWTEMGKLWQWIEAKEEH